MDNKINRNFDLEKRSEGVRDAYKPLTTYFNLNEILNHFNENIEAIKTQSDIIRILKENSKFNKACDDIMRSQIVFLGSSLDFYMHELTKYGLYQIFDENWIPTEKYKNIELKMFDIEEYLKGNNVTNLWFLDFINEYFKSNTMISYEEVKDQLNLIGIKVGDIANAVFYKMNSNVKTIDQFKKTLNELFKRRNIIAHQFDRDHYNAKINDISEDLVNKLLDTIVKIVNAIHSEAIKK